MDKPNLQPATFKFTGTSEMLRVGLRPLALALEQALVLLAITLLGIGLVMVQSAALRVGNLPHPWLLHFFVNPAGLHLFLAVGVMLVLARLDYRRLLGGKLTHSAAAVLMVLAIGLLLLVFTPLGATINGAKRWLLVRVGTHALSFEPSELAKWSLVLFVAAYAVHRGEKIRRFFTGFLPVAGVIAVTCALILKEDFGTAALLAGVSAMLLLMAGVRWWHLAILAPLVLVVGYFAVWQIPYRRERLLIFLHPNLDPRGAGYNPIQSLLSFASGGWPGRGLGNGIQKMGYLPEANTDFIFSLIAEELGFFGCFLVVTLYMGLLVCGWRVFQRAGDLFGKLLAFGYTAMIGLQAAMNIAVATVSVPTKGIALPLISDGGTGWALTAGAVGLLISLERQRRAGLAASVASGAESPQSIKLPVAVPGDQARQRIRPVA